MATPSSAPRPAATSTPTSKGNPVTPSNTHLTSPAAVAMARQFSASHRSPSMRTPGHAHNLSTSSHPSGTPLAAGATPFGAINLGEDTAALNSPAAALLAGLGAPGSGFTPAAGLTPLGMGSGDQGLGITSGSVLQLSGSQLDGNGAIKDPDAERERRLNEILAMLKERVAGRGVCREAIERLAQLAGFTFLWQDDTLTIAGNAVDLEIDFYPESDRVRDVSLKIAISAEAEAEGKEEASNVLKKDLIQDHDSIEWKSLDGFAQNLERLGSLDRLSQGVNCFEAIEGLYESFRKIWTEEKNRMRSQGSLKRLSRSAIGRPIIHRGRRLGLGLDYWATKAALAERLGAKASIDTVGTEDNSETLVPEASIWSGMIECEGGFPSIRVTKDWVSLDALQSTEGDALTESLVNAWIDPPPTLTTQPEGAMETEGSADSAFVPQPPSVRFVLQLEPELLLPITVAPNAFNVSGVNLLRDRGTMKDAQDFIRGLTQDTRRIDDDSPQMPLRWTRTTISFARNNERHDTDYVVSFNTNGPFWCYSVESLAFDHPRQIASLLPVFRQYALLWTLVKSAAKVEKNNEKAPEASPKDIAAPTVVRTGVRNRSNVNPQRAKLAELLSEKSHIPPLPTIDISLRFSTGQQPQPMLDVRFPLYRDLSRLTLNAPAFGSICIEVALGGQLHISSCENIPFGRTVGDRRKLMRILEACEDITTLVAWVHERMDEENHK